MASIPGVCRHAATLRSRSPGLWKDGSRGEFAYKSKSDGCTDRLPPALHTSSRQWAAQNFVMPAMSPTMTEGNIASWKVKEGDAFSAGDVLLEIETDKAQMDVEAQEEGIMARIMQKDGTKSIKVGSRIAVLAEEGDDISSLGIPPEDNPATSSASEFAPSSQPDTPSTSSSESSEQSQTKSQPSQPDADRHPPSTSATKSSGHTYPLYPSVQHLLHQNSIPLSDASKIPASGPNGRLLKGDVLSYLGNIEKSYSSEQSKRLTKMGHLDFSKVKKAEQKSEPKKEAKTEQRKAPPPPELEPATQVALPVSLSAVFATQKRIQESLGLTLPLSTFIARASEIANERLPRAKGAAPSSDELFDAVLGLGIVKKTSRGHYVPQITALPSSGSADALAAKAASRRKQPDVMDILTGTKSKRAPMSISGTPGALGVGGTQNVFSIDVTKGEEKRARTYLERVKTVLEAEPGRCVL